MNAVHRLKHIARMIRPGGGPAGYLYNLKNIALDLQSEKIEVYAFKVSHERIGAASQKANLLVLQAPYFLRKLWALALINVRGLIDILLVFRVKADLGDSFPVFHDQMLAYRYSTIFKAPYGLMPHQPIELGQEVDDFYKFKYNLRSGDVYNAVANREEVAYRNADFLIVPTSSSLDGYFALDSDRNRLLGSASKFFVVSTVKKPKPTLDRHAARQALGLAIDNYAIGFIGRYNYDKGFDLFMSIAESYSDRKNLTFFSAGGGIIKERGPNLQNLGWRKDIADVILAMDLVVIPNRVAYFDLLPIECLMLGTPVAVTAVGGNKWLLSKSYDSSIQEIKFNDKDQVTNFDSLIDSIPSRVDFDKLPLAAFFNDNAFIKSHEEIVERVQKAMMVKY